MPIDPELEPHIVEAGRLNNLDPDLIRAVISGESSGNANVTSNKGAGGIMQIIPSTARAYGIDDPYDPVQGIYGGAKILNDVLSKAEQVRASGRDINPVDYALRTYFAGPEGPKWREQTAAYPGYIAGKYQKILAQKGTPDDGGGGGDAPDGIAQLAAAGRSGPAMAFGGTDYPAAVGSAAYKQSQADAKVRTPHVEMSQAFADARNNGFEGTIQDFQASTAPQVNGTGASVTQAELSGDNPNARWKTTGSGVEGIEKLAEMGKTQSQAPAGVPSDEELLKGLQEIAPLLAGNAAPAQAGPAPAVPVTDQGPQYGPQHIAWAQRKALELSQKGLAIPQYVQELAKMVPGLPGTPQYEEEKARRTATGSKQQVTGPGGVASNMPGSVDSGREAKEGEAAGTALLRPDGMGGYINAPGVAEAAGGKAGAVKKGELEAANPNEPIEATVDLKDGKGPQKMMLPRSTVLELGNNAVPPAQGAQSGTGPSPKLGGQSVLTPGETKGQEGMAAAGTKALDDAHQAELAANRRTQTYGQMAEAMQGFKPGANAELRLRTDRILKDLFGVGFFKEDGTAVPPAEIFQQAGKHLQITAQPKGQGTVSNFERELFSQAVPNMTNSVEGLTKAIEIGKRLDDYDRQVAQIHRDVAKQNNNLPNYVEAQERIANLGPPLSPGETAALERLKPQKPAAGAAPDKAAVEAEMRRRGLLK